MDKPIYGCESCEKECAKVYEVDSDGYTIFVCKECKNEFYS